MVAVVSVLYFPGAETPGANSPSGHATHPCSMDCGSHPGDVSPRHVVDFSASLGAHDGSDWSRHGVGKLVGIQTSSVAG
jgi:hypothetical protein